MTVVAIDGPAGSGKSTVAKKVAARLGFAHVDTGGMYRAIALLALQGGWDLDDGDGLAEISRHVDIQAVGGKVTIDSEDVSLRIRESDVTASVSRVAALPAVRAEMTSRQRALAEQTNLVMEGRDIGSVVFPDAEVKVFLTASLEERVRRRSAQTGEDPGVLRSAIGARDAADTEREASPLAKAEGALVIDSTDHSIDEVVDRIVQAVEAISAR